MSRLDGPETRVVVLPPPPPWLVQEQICPITSSKEALSPANGITSHTGGGILTALILGSLSKAQDLLNTRARVHTSTHSHMGFKICKFQLMHCFHCVCPLVTFKCTITGLVCVYLKCRFYEFSPSRMTAIVFWMEIEQSDVFFSSVSIKA